MYRNCIVNGNTSLTTIISAQTFEDDLEPVEGDDEIAPYYPPSVEDIEDNYPGWDTDEIPLLDYEDEMKQFREDVPKDVGEWSKEEWPCYDPELELDGLDPIDLVIGL